MKKKKIDARWTLFLDRDGVLNRRVIGGYITQPADFEWLPGVLPALHYLTDRFGRTLVITNQQGVGTGLMTEETLHLIHTKMKQQASFANAELNGVYTCTKLADDPTNKRKPKPDLALEAKADFPEIKFSKSVMVGDTASDMEFGRALGMKTVWIGPDKNKKADKSFENLWAFAQWLGA